MPNEAPPDNPFAIISSLHQIYDARKASSTTKSPDYEPPYGSQDIPHPRTVADILARTLFIHLCAALAYALYIRTLKQRNIRRGRNFAAELPGPWWIWPCLSVLLPELVLVQTFLWTMWELWPASAEAMGVVFPIRTHVRRPRAATASNSKTSLFQGVALLIPLYFAGKGYKERFSMHYHTATSIGNLNLDHRNGWSVVSGIVCCTATMIIVLSQLVKNTQSRSGTTGRRSRASSLLADIAEEDEEGWEWTEKDGHPGPSSTITSTQHQRRRDSNDLERSPARPALQTSQQDSDHTTTRKSWMAITSDPDAILPLIVSAVIHQIPLAATNRLPPLTAIFTTRWCLSLLPLLLISTLLLPSAQRAAFLHALTSRTGDKSMILGALLRILAVSLPAFLVLSTVVVQTWTDLQELKDARAGRLRPYNYRWRSKDVFSHGDRDRVYMGG